MIELHTLLIGQPRTITDERGEWRSSIFRSPVAGPVLLEQRGLAGDQVSDTRNHGSPDQAVCCYPLAHYAYWNEVYELAEPERRLGPGSVGENWTLTSESEAGICIGDIFSVGGAWVQVSAPRFPCTKQERKLKLPAFHRRVIETLRTGFYLRVLSPGSVQAGDALLLEERPLPALTVQRVNQHAHHTFDPDFAHKLLEVPELASGWKFILRQLVDKHAAA